MDCTTSACPVEMSAFQLNVIEWGFVSAMDSRLVVDLMVQSDYATCDYDQRVQAATFQINGTDLFLYSTEEPDFQHIFVNPSSGKLIVMSHRVTLRIRRQLASVYPLLNLYERLELITIEMYR